MANRLVKTLNHRLAASERGAVAIIVALFLTVALALTAFVVDLGAQKELRRDLQNAADAAALAGAGSLYVNSSTADLNAAVNAVRQYALANTDTPLGAWPSCVGTPPSGFVSSALSSCIAFDDAAKPTRVWVQIPDEQSIIAFSTVIGSTVPETNADAEAGLNPGGKADCGFCVLGEGVEHNTQNGELQISNGDVHFNGSHTFNPQGEVVITTPDGQITIQGTSGSKGLYSPTPITGADPITDPLAFLQLPPAEAASLSIGTFDSDNCPDGPGVFGDINFRNRTCTLDPGLYVITGLWDLAGSQATVLEGAGVTLYFTCGSPAAPRACSSGGEEGGSLDASGNGSVLEISAPTSGTSHDNLALVYDRNNTETLWLTGNGSSNYVGTIYAKSGTLDYRGNGCGTQAKSLTVVDDVTFSGSNACFSADYNENFNVEIPPSGLSLTK